MDDKTLAPFALPPTEQVFGQPSPSEPAPAAETQKRRRGRPPASEQAKATAKPAKLGRGRKPAAAPVTAIDMLAQIKVLRGLTESEFGVVMTIMKQVPKDSWGNIGRALVELVQL